MFTDITSLRECTDVVDETEIEGKAQNIGGKIQGAVGDLTGDTKTQAEGKAREMYGKAQDAYGGVKDKVTDAYSQVRDNAGDMGGQLMDQLDEFGGTLAQKIEERPFAAVLIAGAIGYALALVTARR